MSTAHCVAELRGISIFDEGSIKGPLIRVSCSEATSRLLTLLGFVLCLGVHNKHDLWGESIGL